MPEKTILIVDDDPTTRLLLTRQLARGNYRVIEAADGEEALQKLERERPDLLITDTLMPRLSGYELVERLRHEASEFARIPIIVISARKSMGDVFNLSDIHCFLSKPLDTDVLHEQVSFLLGEAAQKMPSGEGGSPAGEKPSGGADRSGTVLLCGVQEFILQKVHERLKDKGYRVFVSMDDDDAILAAKEMQPEFIICQYWEKPELFDMERIYVEIKTHKRTRASVFLAFTLESLGWDPIKVVPHQNVITYQESQDLLESLEKCLEAQTYVCSKEDDDGEIEIK